MVVWYASLMEANETLTIGGFEVAARSNEAFLGVAATAFVLLGLSAYLIFLSSRAANTLAVDYAKLTIRRIIASLGNRPLESTATAGLDTPKEVYRLLDGAKKIARLAKLFPRLSAPTIKIFYGSIALLWIDPYLTVSLFLLLLLSIPFYYLVNFFAVQNEHSLKVAQGESRRSGRKLVSQFSQVLHRVDNSNPALLTAVENGPIQKEYEGLLFRFMAGNKSQFVANLSIALVTLAVIGYLGTMALGGSYSWTLAAAYLLVLRIAMVSKRALLMVITRFARFYPELRRLFCYIQSNESADTIEEESVHVRQKPKLALITGRKKIRVTKGHPVALLSPVPLTKGNVFYFSDIIAGPDRDQSDRFLRSAAVVSPTPMFAGTQTIRSAFSIPDSINDQALTEFIKTNGLRSLLIENQSLDRPIKQKTFEKGSPSELVELLLLSAKLNESPFVLVSSSAFSALPPARWSFWKTALKGAFLIVCYPASSSDFGLWGEGTLIAADGVGVRAILDVAEAPEHIARLGTEFSTRDEGSTSPMFLAEDDEDED